MSNRTFEELKEAVRIASALNDASTLDQCALEMDAVDSAEARAAASQTRGIAERLYGNHATALEHWSRALAYYEELGDHRCVAALTGNIGIIHSSMGNTTDALAQFIRALAAHEELGARDGIADTCCNIGVAYSHSGNYPEALEHYYRALTLYEELGNFSGMVSVLVNLGGAFMDAGNYPKALEQFHSASDLLEELGDRRGMALNTCNIGCLHYDMANYQLAIEHFNQALAEYSKLGDRSGLALTTGNIGLVHLATNNYQLALTHFRRALAIHDDIGEHASWARAMCSIIRTLILSGDIDEADKNLAAIDLITIDNPDIVIQRELSRAALQEHRGQFEIATQTLRSALDLAIEINLPSDQATIHKQLRELALCKQDLQGYVHHNNEYTRINEEINGKDTAMRLAVQEAERKMAKERSEHERHLNILHSTLPKHIADRVARGEVVNDHFDSAAVLFVDVVGFTNHSSELDVTVVVNLLQNIFSSFDVLCAKHDVTKIKTIGDSYMAVAFGTAKAEQRTANTEQRTANTEQRTANVMPSEVEAQRTANTEQRTVNIMSSEVEAQRIANVALAMMASEFVWPHTGERVMFRIGIHCGPVVAGVLGTERMQYDVWGDTVNVASRMESTSEPGRIQISDVLAQALNENKNSPPDPLSHASLERGSYAVVARGTVDVKGKGAMQTYWLEQTS